MIRPELKQKAWQFREVLFGLGLVCLMLFFAANSFGATRYVLLAVALLGAAFSFGAFQRARFTRSNDGIGMVELDEGVISYLTGNAGGQVEISEIYSVLLIPEIRGNASWEISAVGQLPLRIPTDAHNVEVLFDAFVKLPGLQTEKMLAQIKKTPDQPVVIWKKRTTALH